MLIIHQNGHLQINLPSNSPAALHHCLAQAIINTLKQQMQSELAIPKNVQESNYYLLQLLENLMPDERQLEQIHQPVEIPPGTN